MEIKSLTATTAAKGNACIFVLPKASDSATAPPPPLALQIALLARFGLCFDPATAAVIAAAVFGGRG